MTLDEVLEKATIEFPRALSLSEAKKFLSYIAEKLPGDASYTVFYPVEAGYLVESGEFSEDEGASIIMGRISSKRPVAFDKFVLKVSKTNVSRLSAIRPQTNNREFGDYSPEVRQLWDNIRKITKRYFKKHGTSRKRTSY